MTFLNKLYIKILSVSLLVALISYNGFESRALPQQFTSEYVILSNGHETVATYSSAFLQGRSSISGFTDFDFEEDSRVFSVIQKARFKMALVVSFDLKEARQKADFLTQVHTSSTDVFFI